MTGPTLAVCRAGDSASLEDWGALECWAAFIASTHLNASSLSSAYKHTTDKHPHKQRDTQHKLCKDLERVRDILRVSNGEHVVSQFGDGSVEDVHDPATIPGILAVLVLKEG